MPNIFQVRTITNGFTGAPGYTQHYFSADGASLGAQDAVDAVRTFWEAVAVQMPTSWIYSIDADVPVLNDSTGALQSVEATTPGTQSVFGDAAAYAGGVGAVTKWLCNEVHGSKRLTGRTFVVPLNSTKYDSTGTIVTSALTALRTAATDLAGHPDFGVWGRPIAGANGLFGLCVASNVRDHVAWLS
ncbi:MAG TPA: hypothetical protein VJQ57_15825, partial [Acidimicrobiia bacterium]|nr:hypothetical protein [Acidimicrobiia bacterium]